MHLSITARVILHTNTNKGTCINVHTVMSVLLVHQSVMLLRRLISVHNVTSGLQGDKKLYNILVLILVHTATRLLVHQLFSKGTFRYILVRSVTNAFLVMRASEHSHFLESMR